MMEKLEEAVRHALGGGAVCLLGAGFARLATDQVGNEVPSVDELKREIRALISEDIGEEASLSDLADYCEGSPDLKKKLQLLLLTRLTLTKPSPAQQSIVQQPWRAIFTTNFDDVVEASLPASRLQIVRPSTSLGSIDNKKIPLYYLHGRAKDLLESDLEPSLVISESNYTSLHEKNRSLYARLSNEIICARSIFIVGYSLKDLDVARIFVSRSDDIKDKTFIICGPNEGPIARRRLAKYGTVLAVGVDGFASALSEVAASSVESHEPQFIQRYQISIDPGKSEIEPSDIESLVLTGVFDETAYSLQESRANAHPEYCVPRRTAIDKILESGTGIRRFVVTSNLGNGKSTFLSELAFHAARRGYQVYPITTNLPEVYREIEEILQRPELILFVIDDVVRYQRLASFIGARLTGLSTLVCTTRGEAEHRLFDSKVVDLGGAVVDIDLDILEDHELVVWDQILERWGLWETRIAESQARRLSFLKKECGGENRAIVLSIFETSSISEKINQIVNHFLSGDESRARAFVVILIVSLCQRHVAWANVVQWCNIDEHNLKKDIQASDVFNFMRRSIHEWYLITSSQLAAFILNTRGYRLTDSVVVDAYTTIVRETAYSADDDRSGFDARENIKELMKYRFLTRLFGETENAFRVIESVYKRLSAVPRIRNYDQFWLQYAMARMEAGDLSNAEKYLNDALGIARAKGAGYSPHQILDQLVRLIFRKNAARPGTFNRREIESAVQQLRELCNRGEAELIYQFRSVPYMLDFIETHADDIYPELRDQMIAVIENIEELSDTKSLHGAKKGEIFELKQATQKALRVLRYL